MTLHGRRQPRLVKQTVRSHSTRSWDLPTLRALLLTIFLKVYTATDVCRLTCSGKGVAGWKGFNPLLIVQQYRCIGTHHSDSNYSSLSPQRGCSSKWVHKRLLYLEHIITIVHVCGCYEGKTMPKEPTVPRPRQGDKGLPGHLRHTII